MKSGEDEEKEAVSGVGARFKEKVENFDLEKHFLKKKKLKKNILVCSIAVHFYLVMCISRTPRARQNTERLVKIYSDTTQ